MLITDRNDFKLKVEILNMSSPKNLFNVKFIRDQYKDNKVIDTSVYDFFVTKQEMNNIGQWFLENGTINECQ